MHQLQKNFLASTFSALIQMLDHIENFLFSYFHHGPEFNAAKFFRSSKTNWTPLIKITSSPTSASSSIVSRFNHHTCGETLISSNTNYSALAEKYILCVGGRGRLYSEYRCLVKSLGGNLLIYRGNQKGDSDRLPDLLACADLIICPVDCVHHETYFAVKFYCNNSDVPCVFLDRSDLPTFRKGVEILASIST